MSGVSSLSLRDAFQILVPAEDGLDAWRGGEPARLRLEPGGLTARDGRIAALEADPQADIVVDARGCALLPGFVDCHTHLPFAGWRAGEYERKVRGDAYADIAREGGGIAASARALREGSDADVLAQARAQADEMLAAGTTTFECKSGYGLSRDGELRQLRLAAELGREVAQATTITALLAHAVPAGHTADGWMDEVEAMLPEVVTSGGVSALDIFVESIAFSNDDLLRMGRLAKQHGMFLRAHVEQLSSHASVPVAIEAGARSVDHLSCMPAADVPALAASDCAAVLLPGAELLGAEQLPPARELADAGAVCVLATDLNPGTSPIVSLPLIAGLAVRHYNWSIKETLLALTLNAAWVLGRSAEIGALEAGRRADVLLLDAPVSHIPYRLGHNPVAAAIVGGRPVWVRPDHAWRFAEASG